jgi:hypothetical protein
MRIGQRKYSVSPHEAEVWAKQFESAQKYLGHINARKDRIAQDLYFYCEWAKKNPDELLLLKNSFEGESISSLLRAASFSW